MKCLLITICLLICSCGQLSPPEPTTPITSDESKLPPPSDRPLILIAINVGQGSSNLIISPDQKTMLIDAGGVDAGKEAIIPLLEQLGIQTIDIFMATHYDRDHIGGLGELVAAGYTPQMIYDRGEPQKQGDVYHDYYLDWITSSRHTLKPGETIELGSFVRFKCLIANGQTVTNNEIAINPQDENAHSLGGVLTFDSFRYFIAGDLPGGGLSGTQTTPALEQLVAKEAGTVDILQVNHHGSETSSSREFLNHLQPTISLISLGNDNPFNHPRPVVLSRLAEINSTIYQTEQGAGNYLENSFVLNDSIFVFVEKDGGYTVNGDEYETK